jgi:hypothetical protein
MMIETFLLRVYYLNDLDDFDCKTCLFIPMQSRKNALTQSAMLDI